MTAAPKNFRFETIGDLLEGLGGIDPRRVRADPLPGTATEDDLIALERRTDRLYELVDGVLVEKVMGYPESALAALLMKLLGNYLDEHDIGLLAGESGGMRLMPGLVRMPDVSFVSWSRLPARAIPREPIAGLAPDLAVEVLSPGNTKEEMARKVREYFFAGARLVWFVRPDPRTVEVFTAPDQSVVLTEDQALTGEPVLPGLSLPIRQIFAKLPPAPEAQAKGKRKKGRRE